jgi:hypothetical protein
MTKSRWSDLDFERIMTKLVAGARSHRNLPVEILDLFSHDTVRPFDAAA